MSTSNFEERSPEEERRRQQTANLRIVVILAITVSLCILVYSSCQRRDTDPIIRSAPTRSAPTQQAPTEPTVYFVRYIVTTNTGGMSLTYRNETENSEQLDTSRSTWSKSFTAEPGQFLYVSAQLDGDGTVTCEIQVNNVVLEEATSRGEYVIATCSGSVDR